MEGNFRPRSEFAGGDADRVTKETGFPHTDDTLAQLREEASIMSRRTKTYSAILLGMVVILPVAAIKYLAAPRDVPAASIPDGQDLPNEEPVSPYLTHQPTILKADAALAPPVDDPPQASPATTGFRDYVTDDDTSTLREASQGDFLPIPSLDAPERR